MILFSEKDVRAVGDSEKDNFFYEKILNDLIKERKKIELYSRFSFFGWDNGGMIYGRIMYYADYFNIKPDIKAEGFGRASYYLSQELMKGLEKILIALGAEYKSRAGGDIPGFADIVENVLRDIELLEAGERLPLDSASGISGFWFRKKSPKQIIIVILAFFLTLLMLSALWFQPIVLRKTYYAGSVLESEFQANGLWVPHGYSRGFFSDGSKMWVGRYWLGKPDGHWKRYYLNGQQENEFYYGNGKMTGPYKAWNKEGFLVEESQFVGGMRNGLCKFYDLKTHGRSEQIFKDNQVYGEVRDYDEAGNLKTVWASSRHYGAGKFHSYKSTGTLDLEGEVGEDWKLNGFIKSYFPSGNILWEGYYKSGVRDGIEKIYFESGDVMVETSFKNGIPEHVVQYGVPGVKVIDCIFQDGLLCKTAGKDDNVSLRFPNGSHAIEFSSHDGSPHGLFRRYYESGHRRTEGQYVSGRPDGFFYTFDEAEHVISQYGYDQGKLI